MKYIWCSPLSVPLSTKFTKLISRVMFLEYLLQPSKWDAPFIASHLTTVDSRSTPSKSAKREAPHSCENFGLMVDQLTMNRDMKKTRPTVQRDMSSSCYGSFNVTLLFDCSFPHWFLLLLLFDCLFPYMSIICLFDCWLVLLFN